MSTRWHRILGGFASDDGQAVIERRLDANRTPYWLLNIAPSNDHPGRRFIRFYDRTGLDDAKAAYRPGRTPLVPVGAHQVRAERTIAITTDDTLAGVLRRLFGVEERPKTSGAVTLVALPTSRPALVVKRVAVAVVEVNG